jgi:phosphoribosylamine--glycine ligase
MNVLVVGRGGREHALCWKLARSRSVRRVVCVPGSAGIAGSAECAAVPDEGLVAFARERAVDLVVVGPEAPLVGGLADRLRQAGIGVFGPGTDGARLEGSKVFAKAFMQRHGVPTAACAVAASAKEAFDAVEAMGGRVVVKADGLAAGKGVIVCEGREEARGAVERLMVKAEMGEAGRRLVIEERLEGREVSVIAVCDGSRACLMLPTQDHKRIRDGDEGPNTGGMGAYAPAVKVAPPALLEAIRETVVAPTLRGLRSEGVDFRGALYCGLMIAPGGEPKVLEYNVRFGDPETQPQMALLDEDLGELLLAAAAGSLDGRALRWKPGAAVTVVLSAEGYPGEVTKGDTIEGLETALQDEEHVVFHAGTARKEGRWVTDGGRVLGVTAVGKDLPQARERAYRLVDAIRWRGMHFRKDIGLKGI